MKQRKTAVAIGSVEQRRGQWLKGVFDLCVLAALDDTEAYGYELAKTLEAAGLGEVKGGTLYPALNRLERDGLVTTSWRSSDQGPDRKYYRMSPTGGAAVQEARSAWQTFASIVDNILSAGSDSKSEAADGDRSQVRFPSHAAHLRPLKRGILAGPPPR